MSGRIRATAHVDDDRSALARCELGIRRARFVGFGACWIGDSWWDILLLLYLADGADPYDIGNLAGRIGHAVGATERWLGILGAQGHVEQAAPNKYSAERGWILTNAGRLIVEHTLDSAMIRPG